MPDTVDSRCGLGGNPHPGGGELRAAADRCQVIASAAQAGALLRHGVTRVHGISVNVRNGARYIKVWASGGGLSRACAERPPLDHRSRRWMTRWARRGITHADGPVRGARLFVPTGSSVELRHQVQQGSLAASCGRAQNHADATLRLSLKPWHPSLVRGRIAPAGGIVMIVMSSSATGQTVSLRPRVYRLAPGGSGPDPVILRCSD